MYAYRWVMTLTREDIVRAATRLAGERGADAVSMRGVARELGVSPMALYNHVADREDLIGAIVQSFMAFALDGDGGVAEHAERFFSGLRRWPYMAGLVREAAATARLDLVDEMLSRVEGDRARAEEDWLALSELALGLVGAVESGTAGKVDVDAVFARAARALRAE